MKYQKTVSKGFVNEFEKEGFMAQRRIVEGEQRRNGEKRKRKGENETETVNRRCEGSASVRAFEIFSQGRDLESYGNLSWGNLLDELECLFVRESEAWVVVPVVPDVIDELFSFSSVVTEFFCGGFSCCPDWELVEPQSLSFFKKRAHCTVPQEEMRSGRIGYTFIQIGMKVALFIQKIVIQNHFHPKTTFIPKPLSSKTTFIQKPLSSQNPEP